MDLREKKNIRDAVIKGTEEIRENSNSIQYETVGLNELLQDILTELKEINSKLDD